MIGEFLAHIFVRYCLAEIKAVSPYFNLEERSIKKGFDIIFYNSSSHEIWITEVKSGNIGQQDTVDEKNLSLLTKAKDDLLLRLTGHNNMVWRNALNGIEVTLGHGTEKEKIRSILESNLSLASSGQSRSDKENVILTGVVYGATGDTITYSTVEGFKNQVDATACFKNTIVFSIQKETYSNIVNFLREEATQDG